MRVLGIILAGGMGGGIWPLTSKRASAAVPVFGKYRAVDFTLSNMVNSGITKVGILTQYNPRSLMDHLGSGKDWDLDMTLLRRGDEDYVLIGSGDHIYNMNYSEMMKQHLASGADVTFVVKELDNSYNLSDYGIVEINEDGRIVGFEEKPKDPQTDLASLGIYFMNKHLLMDLLYATVPHGGYDLLLDVLLPNIRRFFFRAYRFGGYWRNVKKGILEYYRTNMSVLDSRVRRELFRSKNKIYTKLKDLPPPKVGATGSVQNSIVADGCIVNGIVRNSILFRSVTVRAGAVIEDSIIFEGSSVEEGAHVICSIVDKDSVVRASKIVRGSREHPLAFEKSSVL